LNPDPHFSEFVVVGCIRIRIYHRWAKTADKKEKIKKCVVVKCWNLSLEGWRLLLWPRDRYITMFRFKKC